ncbi:MAG: hypothetical protein K9K67_13790 [Bacteriovoracaceae bacterium]|nr:hypothetical protein [Bacteriovoracaceae bacterium]
MKLKNSLILLLIFIVMGCAHNQETASTELKASPVPNRSTASSSQDIAKAYFNLASTLSKARANSGVCESGVYQENIIQALNNARQFEFDNGYFIYQYLNDSSNPETNAIEAQVGNTLSYKLLKSKNMGLGAYNSKGSVSALMKNTSFESQGVGAYGHFLEYHFKANNKLVKRRLTNIDSWPIEWSETEGTWESNGYSNKHGGPLISIRSKYLTGPNKDKLKTEVFVIKQTCGYGECFYGLLPVNKVDKKQNWNTPEFRDFRVFDLKTDECDA